MKYLENIIIVLAVLFIGYDVLKNNGTLAPATASDANTLSTKVSPSGGNAISPLLNTNMETVKIEPAILSNSLAPVGLPPLGLPPVQTRFGVYNLLQVPSTF